MHLGVASWPASAESVLSTAAIRNQRRPRPVAKSAWCQQRKVDRSARMPCLAAETTIQDRLPRIGTRTLSSTKVAKTHPLFQGMLPIAIGPLSDRLKGFDLAVVIGAPVFRYYPYIAGSALPPGCDQLHVTTDPSGGQRPSRRQSARRCQAHPRRSVRVSG